VVASSTSLLEQAAQFMHVLSEWEQNLPTLSWNHLTAEARQGHVALFSVDMVNGFCHEGALASPRIKDIIPEVVAAFEGAYIAGVRNFVLAQDCHPPDAVEFANFPPHCQIQTSEAETIPELARLPFAHHFTLISKNSLNAFYGTKLGSWLEAHRNLNTAVIVGNCTDLCVYQMAMHLKLDANAHNRKTRVIVIKNAVQTYDVPLDVAQQAGALPHNGDILHLMFLYHMSLNGIEVVQEMMAPEQI